MNPLIITHKNCIDGLCSKAIFEMKFQKNATYLELDYANLDFKKDLNANFYINKILSKHNSIIYISDFCLEIELIEKLLTQNNQIIILDHHESNIPKVEYFENKINKGEKLKIFISFSKNNFISGAKLTWEYLYPNKKIPKLVQLVSDGDTWKFEYGIQTKYFYAYLSNLFIEPKKIPPSFLINLLDNDTEIENFIKKGEIIYSNYIKEVMNFVPLAKPIILDGKIGLFIQADKKYVSDLGNQLALLYGSFGLVYNIDLEGGFVKCSLRSLAPFSVKDIAQKFGGGGHAQASAFSCNNISEFKNLLKSNGNKNISFDFNQLNLF